MIIGLNMKLSDSFMSCLDYLLIYARNFASDYPFGVCAVD